MDSDVISMAPHKNATTSSNGNHQEDPNSYSPTRSSIGGGDAAFCNNTTATAITETSKSRLGENHLLPNHELTHEEKYEKLALKRLLKRQTRRRKLETRLQQAIMRRDAAIEALSRKELDDFLQSEQYELLKTHPVVTTVTCMNFGSTCIAGSINEIQPYNIGDIPTEAFLSRHKEAQARREIEALYFQLYRLVQRQEMVTNLCIVKNDQPQHRNRNNIPTKDIDAGFLSLKEKQAAEARQLLQNMTRGTQTEGMFDNHHALVGYMRQKFQERACLAISSLCNLDPSRLFQGDEKVQAEHPLKSSDDEKYDDNHDIQDINDRQRRIWNRLTVSSGLRSICSIGCGPGCDVTGIVTFLKHFATPTQRQVQPNSSTSKFSSSCNGDDSTAVTNAVVDRIIFLDWTVERWNHFLHPLVDHILKPNNLLGESASLAFCDVLQPLSADCNAVARELLLPKAQNSSNANQEGELSWSTIDLFVTSYLLTETRGKWHSFYRELIEMAKPGALFLFAEPKGWQLHILIEQFSSSLEFVWLDSSMHSPMLQALENRIGPAVVITMKRES